MNIKRILIIYTFIKNLGVFIELNNLLVKISNIKLITVSKAVKKDLIISSGFNKIKVIYNGLSKICMQKIKREKTKFIKSLENRTQKGYLDQVNDVKLMTLF